MKIASLLLLVLFTNISTHAQSIAELKAKGKKQIAEGNFKEGIFSYEQAAKMGDAEAQYNYAFALEAGGAEVKDVKLANEWFLKSALQKYPEAELKLAYNYGTGTGLPQDYKQAFYWSHRCAEQGDPECMYNIISCYQEGLGTEKNTDSMIYWLVTLATSPNPDLLQKSQRVTMGRLHLAYMYKEGKVLQKNPMKSLCWFLIYNEHKTDVSVGEQQVHIGVIEELVQDMSLSEQKEAREDAEKILGHPLTQFDKLYKAVML